MKKSVKIFFFTILGVFSFLCANEVFAQRGTATQSETVNVRLASFMPKNSDWGRCLERMAAECARVTSNRVRLIIIHDGLEGNEQKTLSSLSTNNIQAALYTSFGLHSICPSVITLSAPFLIRTEAELDLVLKEARPLLDAQVSKTSFVVMAWSKGGWVNIFSKEPVVSPDDLRRQKMATNPDVPTLNTAFKAMGFNLVEADIIDLGTKIASNSINAFYQTPASVAPLGLYKQLNNMMDITISPFLGAIVINRVTWNKISPADQNNILQAMQRIASEFDAIMPRMVINALAQMQRDGLKVNKISPAQEKLWHDEIQKVMPPLLGNKTFDPDLYNKISDIVRKSRSGQ